MQIDNIDLCEPFDYSDYYKSNKHAILFKENVIIQEDIITSI